MIASYPSRGLDRTPVNTVGFAGAANGWAVGPKGLLMKYAGAALDARRH